MKSIKIISIIGILVIVLLFSLTATIYAREEEGTDGGAGGAGNSSWGDIDTGYFNPGEITGYESAFEKARKVINVLQVIGIIVAVIGIMALGIKYMVGSVEQRADYKKTMLPYVIGIIMIVTIISIVSLIYTITTQVANGSAEMSGGSPSGITGGGRTKIMETK